MIDFDTSKPRNSVLDLTPMIDVVFLLLIFFLLTSVFARPMLPLTLPEAASADMAQEPEVSITIHADASLLVDNEPVSQEDLSALLLAKFEGKERPALSLRADRGVSFGQVVAIMDLAKGAGAVDISVATEVVQ